MIFQLIFIILKLIFFKYNINKKYVIISKIQLMNILSQKYQISFYYIKFLFLAILSSSKYS